MGAKGPGECVTFDISSSRAGSDGARHHFVNQDSNLGKGKRHQQSVTHLISVHLRMSNHSRNAVSVPAQKRHKKKEH